MTTMLLLMFIAGAGVAGVRVTLARGRTASLHALVGAYGFSAAGFTPAVEEGEAPKGPFAALGGLARDRMAPEKVAAVQRELLAAGDYETSVERILAQRVAAAIVIPPLFFYAGLISAGLPAGLGLGLIGAYVGYAAPRVGLQRAARMRLEEVDKAMPELVDLLVVAVESGMGLAASMRVASARIDGPLGDELRLVLQEQGLGVNLPEALRHLLERCDTPAVRSFVTTIVQGERLGASIGTMMRALAVDMRKRRRAQAEEQAHKTPIKILFPLVLFIFPSLFLVLLGPAALSILEGFGG